MVGEVKSFRRGPETERLTHREFAVNDAAAAFALNGNAEVMRFTAEPMMESVDAAREFIANDFNFARIGYGRWACVLKETESVIGFCGLKYLPEFDEVDVGYRFLPQHWGQGLATEACLACLDFGFDEIGLPEIVAYVIPENVASVRVLEKSGMRFDSEFDYEGTPTLRFLKRKR